MRSFCVNECRIRKCHLGVAAAVLAILLAAGNAAAQDSPTEHTRALAEGAASPPAEIADVAWLAGSWGGEAMGGWAEDLWSKPNGGSVMCVFRLVKDGKPVFYEILIINEEEGSLMLRLKHFHPDLHGWEEKDQVIEFPLVALEDRAVYFDGITFQLEGEDALIAYVRSKGKDGKVSELEFRYSRM